MNNKKKILYLITKSVWAGAGKYVYDLAANLSKDEFSARGGPASGWEVFVAAGGQGPLAQKISQANIPYFEIKHFQRDIGFLKEILALFEVLKLLKKIKPDIVHVSSSKAGGIGGLAAKIYSIPAIFTVHGWAFNEPRPKWQNVLIKIASKITAGLYNKIICVSEYDRQIAIASKITKPEKLITIHNGIKEPKFLSKQEARKFFKMSDKDILIGTVGEFTRNKGQKYLIEVAEKLENFKFILIGWGEKKENLKFKIENLKLKSDVFLVDNLSPASPYLKAFDIFVLPSLKEGLAYTLLEAGLAELPVIAAKVGGNPEIIENQKTGLLVKPADSDELAKAIEKLLINPELSQTLASNLYQKIISQFSFEKMLRETINLYKQ